MLSKHTRTLFSKFVKVSHFKPNGTVALLSQFDSSVALKGSPQFFKELNLYSRFSFSASSKEDPNNKNPTNSNSAQDESTDKSSTTAEKPKKADSSKKKSKAKAASGASTYSYNVENKKLEVVPIRPSKLPLKEGDEQLTPETYVLFSSNTPIVPYSQQSGLITTGNLRSNHISNKLAFFLQNENGEIYTVGLVLEDKINKSLKKNIPQKANLLSASPEEKKKHKANITTKSKDYKIKLIEIEFKDNCIFAKGIPYKDSKPTEAEKKVNIPEVLSEIKEIAISIRDSVAPEKINVFSNLSAIIPEDEKIKSQKLDEILCYILGECYKLSTYTYAKEGLQQFETFLEERSIVARMFMVKKILEDIRNVLNIIKKSVHFGDEKIFNGPDNATARQSFEYIRSNYFSGEQGSGNQASKGANAGAQSSPVNLTGPAKKFMEKLPLIKDEVSRDKVKKEIERFALQDKMSGEYHKLYTYLDDVFSIPWETYSEEYWDIEYSHKVLEKQLFGLEKVKERIVEMIAVNKLKRVGSNDSLSPAEKRKGFVILLNGPPGTGKTTIAKAIATALKRESRFISFAGVTDPAFVKGHKRTYLDAQPGVFIKELVKARTMNPVFILDEVDKLSKHHQGVDPYYALMEILNPEENHNFTDHYLDIKVDFSNVIFILTANQILNILEPLRNRLEIIEVPPYIEQEKLLIGKQYLLPAVLEEHGLNQNNIKVDDQAFGKIIQGWCYYESGVRELRRCLEKISRKYALEILDLYSNEHPQTQISGTSENDISAQNKAEENVQSAQNQSVKSEVVIDSQNIDFQIKGPKSDASELEQEKTPGDMKITTQKELFNKEEVKQLIQLRNEHKLIIEGDKDESDELLKKYLGLPIFDDMIERKDKKLHPGTVNVLTVSGFVGHVLSVECVYDVTNPEKKGQFSCSGNLQKVLQESLTIAKLVALKFLPPEKIKEVSEKNIHIHFLSGSTPKDGPSAGISICTALLSLVLNKPINANISMTGELSLNEEVYKIGGVQAKVTASKALNINKIILPWGNKTDFFELPQLLKENLEVYFVKEFKEVFEILFGNSPQNLEKIERVVNGKHLIPRETNNPASTISN